MTLDERQLCNGGVAMLVNVAARPRHPANCGHVRSELDSLWRCAEPRGMFPLDGTNLSILRIGAEPTERVRCRQSHGLGVRRLDR